MTRGRTKKPPITRNLELYHEIVCENKTQDQVAAEFEISQPRVAAVHRKVHRWVESLVAQAIDQARPQLPVEKLRLDAGQKLHLAISIRRIELQQAYGQFLHRFGGSAVAIAFIPILAEWDAGSIPEPLTRLLPPGELIRTAITMASELDDLACLAERGPYLHLTDQLIQTRTNTTPPPAPTVSPNESPIASVSV